jgi:hypothetical protein
MIGCALSDKMIVLKASWRACPANRSPALTPTTGAIHMVEAISSLAPSRAQRQAERMRLAVRVLCQHRAQEEVKARLRREGRVKLSTVPHREIVAMAEAAVMADAKYRAELIAKAKRVVEQWRAEGSFGKAVQNFQYSHKLGSAEPRALPLCETHDRNGAGK